MKKIITLLVGFCLTSTIIFSQTIRTVKDPCLPGEILIFYTTNISPYDTLEINKRSTKWLGMDCKPRYGVDKDLLLQQTKINFYVCKDTTNSYMAEKGVSGSLRKDLEDLKKAIEELKEERRDCPDCILNAPQQDSPEPKDSLWGAVRISPFFEGITDRLMDEIPSNKLRPFGGVEFSYTWYKASTKDIKKIPLTKSGWEPQIGLRFDGWKLDLREANKNNVSCDTCWAWESTQKQFVARGTAFAQIRYSGKSNDLNPANQSFIYIGPRYTAVEYANSKVEFLSKGFHLQLGGGFKFARIVTLEAFASHSLFSRNANWGIEARVDLFTLFVRSR